MRAALKVFLASGGDLLPDRDALERYLLARTNEHLRLGRWERTIKPVRWEEVDLSVSVGPKQDDLDRSLLGCDVVVVLVGLRLGPNTLHEFEVAYEAVRRDPARLKLFVYFKEGTLPVSEAQSRADDLKAVDVFRKRIDDLHQIHLWYRSPEDLAGSLEHQLLLLVASEAEGLSETEERERRSTGLPPPPSVFVDRKEERRWAVDQLRAGRIVHVRGLGGIGKTDLATVIGHDLPEFRDRVLFFHRYDITGRRAVLNRILQRTGRSGALRAEEREVIAVVRDELGGDVAKFLLVLDNVERGQHAEVEELLAIRGRTPVLITSRREEELVFRGAEVLDLRDLSSDDSVRLLRERAALALTPGQYEELLRILPGNPYFLTCAAQQFNAANLDPERLLRLLRLQPDLIAEDYRSVREIFAYGYERMTESQRRLLSVLVTFGADSFDIASVVAVAGGDPQADVDLYRLERWTLVRPHPVPGRFFIHPLTRYCAEKVLPEGLVRESGRAMVRYFLGLAAKARREGGMGALTVEKGNLLAAIDHAAEAADDGAVVELVRTLNGDDGYTGFFGRYGYWREGIAKTGLAADAARRLGDVRLEACFRRDVALFHYWLGANRDALTAAEESLRVVESLRRKDEVIRVRHVMGYITDDEGDYVRAEGLYRTALAEALELGDTRLIALGHHLVGVIEYHVQDYERARESFRTCLDLLEGPEGPGVAAREERRADRARCRRRFAALERMRARYGPEAEREGILRGALACVDEALASETGGRSRARGWRQRGMILEALGDRAEAGAEYGRSLAAFETIGNLKGVGTAKFNLGWLALEEGRWDDAEPLLERSREVAQSVSCPIGVARVDWGRGLIAARRPGGDRRAAREHLERARRYFERSHPLHAGEVARDLAELG
jgi:tetratricopeptide (TPR) repeat protein